MTHYLFFDPDWPFSNFIKSSRHGDMGCYTPALATDNKSKISYSPPANVSENESSFQLRLELVGLEREDIDLAIDADVLTVTGERKSAHSDESGKTVWREIAEGCFEKRFKLPDTIERDKITAELKNGLLIVNLPKKEKEKTQKISVTVA